MINDILNDPAKIVFVVAIFCILFELVSAFIFFNMTRTFVANARTAKAKITKLEPHAKSIKAFLTIKDLSGRYIETSVMLSRSTKHKEADEIEILSSKDNPEKVRLNSFMSLWILPITMFYSAITLSVVLGILVYIGYIKW